MKKLISAAPKKSLEIAGAFIISAVFTFFFTFVVISSTYTVMSDEEHAELLGEIDEANIKANDREWNSNHYKEKLEEMSVSLESTQSQLSNATKALTKMNINYAETNTLLDQISKIAGKCATIKGSMSRLTCFDRIPKMIASAKENAELNYSSVEKIGYWSLTQHRTPAKKLISVFLTANAQNVTSDTDTKIKPSLNLHCDTKKTNAYIDWGFDIDGIEVKLLTRFDQSPAEKITWGISKTGHHTIAPGSSQQFIKDLVVHKHFFAQIRNQRNQPVLATFNLVDLQSIIKPLRVACAF